MSVWSTGDYGISKGLYFSVPCTCEGGKWTIVKGLEVSGDLQKKIKVTEDELLEEKREAGF